jgi:hypothetical protein
MRPFLWFGSRLCLALSLTIVAVMIVGRRQPASEGLVLLHLTDCAPPCWIGIVPGQTALNDARYRLGEVFGREPNGSPNVGTVMAVPLPEAATPAYLVLVYFDSVQKMTTRIELRGGSGTPYGRLVDPASPLPSLGDLVSRLGTPSCVLGTPTGLWNIFYKLPNGVVVIRITGSNLRWTQSVDSVSLQQPDLENVYCHAVWRNASWRGLISLNRYQRGA